MSTEVRTLPKLPARRPDSHKGDFGKVLVLAGSVGMTGAAYLTAKSALRAGAGIVTLGIPASLNPIMEVKLTCCMTYPLPELAEGGALGPASFDEVLALAKGFELVVAGPGLGRRDETQELVQRLIQALPHRLLLDADALYACRVDSSILRRKPETIVTPHPGEMAALIGSTAREVQEDRLQVASDFAKNHGLTTVLKGYQTVVTDGDRYYVNQTGNPGMATAGSGDVLTGLIGGLWAQGLAAFEAAQLGVYLHGKAGDFAKDEKGEASMIASDILTHLPAAIKAHQGT